jgi:hypothetical protein
MVVVFVVHVGIRCLGGNTETGSHAIQDGCIDDGGLNPGSNETLLYKDCQG